MRAFFASGVLGGVWTDLSQFFTLKVLKVKGSGSALAVRGAADVGEGGGAEEVFPQGGVESSRMRKWMRKPVMTAITRAVEDAAIWRFVIVF